MTGSSQSPDGKRAKEPEGEIPSGSAAASRAKKFGVPGPQVGASFGDDDITDGDDGEDGGTDDDEVAEGEIVDPLAAVTAQRDEYLDSLRRLQAEFDNYRKRVAKQQTEQAQRAAVSLVDKLLPVLDALELAATHSPDPESDDARALAAASSLLTGALAKEGLERIDPVGQLFDPNSHEAVGHVPADADAGGDEAPAKKPADGVNGAAGAGGHAYPGEAGAEDEAAPNGAPASHDGPVVAQVMRPGYRWKGTVIRPAMVMVYG
jgi:molecular chaperone GrpE